jgi:hypothetical protein
MQPANARNMFFALMIVVVLALVAAGIVFIESVRPEKDNVALYVVMFGFGSTTIALFATKMMSASEIDKQNVVLGDIQHKVNGGTERAMNALREQHRVAMHDLKGMLGTKDFLLKEKELQLEKAEAKQRELEADLRACRDKALAKSDKLEEDHSTEQK